MPFTLTKSKTGARGGTVRQWEDQGLRQSQSPTPSLRAGIEAALRSLSLKRSPLCLEITAYIGKRFGFHFILFHRAPAYLDQSYRVLLYCLYFKGHVQDVISTNYYIIANINEVLSSFLLLLLFFYRDARVATAVSKSSTCLSRSVSQGFILLFLLQRPRARCHNGKLLRNC